eukprot:13715905-Ditylum_brightwellii.AAC.1
MNGPTILATSPDTSPVHASRQKYPQQGSPSPPCEQQADDMHDNIKMEDPGIDDDQTASTCRKSRKRRR